MQWWELSVSRSSNDVLNDLELACARAMCPAAAAAHVLYDDRRRDLRQRTGGEGCQRHRSSGGRRDCRLHEGSLQDGALAQRAGARVAHHAAPAAIRQVRVGPSTPEALSLRRDPERPRARRAVRSRVMVGGAGLALPRFFPALAPSTLLLGLDRCAAQ